MPCCSSRPSLGWLRTDDGRTARPGLHEWEKTYAVEPSATLEIENTNGAIDVRTHAAPTIIVKAQRTAKAMSEQGARELLARTNLEQRASADFVRLATPHNQGFSRGQQLEVRYEVLVPATIAVNLTTVNGKVELDGVTGAVALKTVNGGIEAQGLTGLRKAETVNGSIRLGLGSLPSEGAQIETVNGSVAVSMPSAAPRTCRSGPSMAASPSTGSSPSPMPSASGATTRAS